MDRVTKYKLRLVREREEFRKSVVDKVCMVFMVAAGLAVWTAVVVVVMVEVLT